MDQIEPLEITRYIEATLIATGHSRDYEILKRRYGFDGSQAYTLQNIGDFHGLTRERVRQLVQRGIRTLRACLIEDSCPGELVIRPEIHELIKSLRENALDHGPLVTLGDVLDSLRNLTFVQDPEGWHSILNFIADCFELEKLPTALSGHSIAVRQGWLTSSEVSKSSLVSTLPIVYGIVRSVVVPISLFDLTIECNRSRKGRIEPQMIRLAVVLCEDIELLEEDLYQLRFERLSSLADKAYRILGEVNVPMHFRELARETNRRLVLVGQAPIARFRSVQSQLVEDDRFEPVGRGGYWSLAEWEHVVRETIVGLMLEHFHASQSASSPEEVYDYVKAKRPDISRASIYIYLTSRNDLFIRTGTSKFELASWGGKPAPKRTADVEISIARLDEISQRELGSAADNTLPLITLVRVVSQNTGLSEGSIYRLIYRSRMVDIYPDPRHSQRKIAILRNQPREPDPPSLQRDPSLRQKMRVEVQKFLYGMPAREAPLSEVVSHILQEMNCSKGTVYQYLSSMEQIEKRVSEGVVICVLVGEEPKSLVEFQEVQDLADEGLKEGLMRAISLINIENVDIGYFELGRLFESELRTFLMNARRDHSFEVTRSDLRNLSSMIDCVERNQIIANKHHLTFLRHERNQRAHASPPSLEQRRELLDQAQFITGIFVYYIFQFHNLRGMETPTA